MILIDEVFLARNHRNMRLMSTFIFMVIHKKASTYCHHVNIEHKIPWHVSNIYVKTGDLSRFITMMMIMMMTMRMMKVITYGSQKQSYKNSLK